MNVERSIAKSEELIQLCQRRNRVQEQQEIEDIQIFSSKLSSVKNKNISSVLDSQEDFSLGILKVQTLPSKYNKIKIKQNNDNDKTNPRTHGAEKPPRHPGMIHKYNS